MTALRLAISGFIIAILASAAQQPAASDVDAMLRQARDEIRDFEKAGGKKDDPNHPVDKWVQALWKLREQSPRPPGSAKATSEAVHLLIHADRFSQTYARVDQVAPGDPAWEGLAEFVFEAASLQKDFKYLFEKLNAVLPETTDPNALAAIHFSLGRAWRARNSEDKAKAAFEAAIESARDSSSGRQAEMELYELLHLGPGQPAPEFSAAAVDGSPVSLADYRGKPVVLVFWGTH